MSLYTDPSDEKEDTKRQMNESTQPTIWSVKKRPFATSAVALQAIIVDEKERVLLLSSPVRNASGEWQVISGGLEAGETVLDGVLREAVEEAGPEVAIRPLGVVHAQTFHYDANVQFMIGIYYLLAFEGGRVVPGDDMVGSEYRWWSIAELETSEISFHASTHLWMLKRAVELYRIWSKRPTPSKKRGEPTLSNIAGKVVI